MLNQSYVINIENCNTVKLQNALFKRGYRWPAQAGGRPLARQINPNYKYLVIRTNGRITQALSSNHLTSESLRFKVVTPAEILPEFTTRTIRDLVQCS